MAAVLGFPCEGPGVALPAPFRGRYGSYGSDLKGAYIESESKHKEHVLVSKAKETIRRVEHEHSQMCELESMTTPPQVSQQASY